VIVCQSNFMRDARACTIRGEHEDTCDGFEYRHSVDTGEDVATGRECRGCAPRPAFRGFVCQSCYEMILSADAVYGPWARALRGVERAITPEPGGGRALGYVPIGGLELDRDAIRRAYRSHPGHLDTWISSEHGAADAIRFGLLMRSAVDRHPVKEEPHQLRRTYCPACRQLTFIWHPPTYPGGPVKVRCKACGFVAPEPVHDDIAHIESVYSRKGK